MRDGSVPHRAWTAGHHGRTDPLAGLHTRTNWCPIHFPSDHFGGTLELACQEEAEAHSPSPGFPAWLR